MTNDRSEIPQKYKWDLSVIYKDADAFEEDFKKAERYVADFGRHRDTMLDGAAELLSMFRDFYKTARLIYKLNEYASRSFDVDTSVNEMQALSARTEDLFRRFEAAAYFMTPYIHRLDDKKLEGFYARLPELEKYRRNIFDLMRRKPHTLSEECEKLLADMSTGMGGHGDIYEMLVDCDLNFDKIRDSDGNMAELTGSNYIIYAMDPERRVRRAAFNALYRGYDRVGNTIATVLYNFIKERVAVSKVRGFSSSLEASVFEDEVGTEIYENLIATVRSNLSPLFRYYELKRKSLHLSKLHVYDIYSMLLPELDQKISYDEAVEEVLDAVSIFGSEYRDTLEKGLKEQNWVDVYPTSHKRGGAYSSGCYDTLPYIMLNFNNFADDAFTLAHEAGHSMHSYFSRKYNDCNVSEYTIFVAEVASTVNELILAHRRLAVSEEEGEKLSILNMLMESFKGTLFRQTMFADFEKQLYEAVEKGIPLTKDFVSEKYYGLVKEYFGPDVVCDAPIAREWMRIPHFYYNFYVYKYATCISAAASIVRKIESEGEPYVKKYIEFLKCGGSKSPLESLKVAEIDMTSPSVILDAISEFSDTVAKYAEIRYGNPI